MPGANLCLAKGGQGDHCCIVGWRKIVEDFAKPALESGKLDFPTFERLASLVRQHLKSSLSRARPLMTQDTQTSYLVFGAWVHGGLFGITKKTLSHSWLCKYINAFVEKSSPKGFTWTSFVFNFNGKVLEFVDGIVCIVACSIPHLWRAQGYGMYNACNRAAPFGSREKKRDRLELYCLTW